MIDHGWRELELAARAQVAGDLDVLEATPLEFGAHLAWSGVRHGLTDGVSAVHRVGFPNFGRVYTTCMELIPAPLRWIPLSPAMVRTMSRCKYCEAELARIARENAA